MGRTKAVWRAEVTPQLSDHGSARAWFERKPVTDSVVSYAGTRDPVTGKVWGQVMSMGGGAGYSYDRDGNGVYGDVSYHSYRGDNVLDNHNVEVNAGGYIKAWGNDRSQLTAGVNVNYQAYGNNQNQFTYGQGGYFSPQSFLALSFPINYHYQYRKVEAKAGVTPGFQSFSQNQTDLYPTDAAAQATLNAAKAADNDVRNYYDSLSKTGFGISATGSLYYTLSPATRVGGEVSYNTFGSYNEFRSMVGFVRLWGAPNEACLQQFGPHTGSGGRYAHAQRSDRPGHGADRGADHGRGVRGGVPAPGARVLPQRGHQAGRRASHPLCATCASFRAR
jgi:hypothetical protein